MNGPLALLLAAIWNFNVVLTGRLAVHDKVDQFVVLPAMGFASFRPETKVPEVA